MRATSETILAKKNTIYALCAMLGPMTLYVYRSISIDTGTLSAEHTGILLTFISRVEGVVLPRSLMELTRIEEVMGLKYYFCVAFLDAAISCFSLLAIVSTLVDAYNHPVDSFQHPTTITILPTKSMVTSLFIAFIALFFGPAEFNEISLYQNYVDSYGIYFVKTALIITVGYYNLNNLLLNAFFSIFRVNRVFIPK